MLYHIFLSCKSVSPFGSKNRSVPDRHFWVVTEIDKWSQITLTFRSRTNLLRVVVAWCSISCTPRAFWLKDPNTAALWTTLVIRGWLRCWVVFVCIYSTFIFQCNSVTNMDDDVLVIFWFTFFEHRRTSLMCHGVSVATPSIKQSLLERFPKLVRSHRASKCCHMNKMDHCTQDSFWSKCRSSTLFRLDF